MSSFTRQQNLGAYLFSTKLQTIELQMDIQDQV
jgi:hypothetical protein